MVKSDTELAVVYRSAKAANASSAREKTAPIGVLQDVLGAEHGRLKILRLSKADRTKRGALLKRPDIEAVGTVYRFAGSPGPVVSMGRIAVRVRGDLSDSQRRRLWAAFGLSDVEPFDGLDNVYIATVGADTDDVLVAERLADDPRTVWAHPDFIRVYRPLQVTPTDTFFDLQWHLNNTGQTVDGIADADIDALEAWSIADGQGVLFGMFDDSCDVDHEDLSENYIGTGQDVSLAIGAPGADDPRPKLVFDFHGTAVMGLAVATGNGLGVRGVSFRSRFTVTRGLNEFVPDSLIARSYLFAIDQGVDVHINSWGPDFPSPVAPVLADAIDKAFTEGRDLDGEGGDDPKGMLIFFSSGNGDFFTGVGGDIPPGFGPSTLASVVAVGASSDRDTRADFSDFGRHLAFLAPGEASIVTVDNDESETPGAGLNDRGFLADPDFGGIFTDQFGFPIVDIDPNGKYTGSFGGTSASCPIAAGIAGLILSVNNQLTAKDVLLIMEHTCDKIERDVAAYNGITDRSLTHGYGRVNAQRAVTAAQDSLTNGGLTWPDMPTNVTVTTTTLRWLPGVGTDEFLVVEANFPFGFIPEDGVCYDANQLNCTAADVQPLPANVTVLSVGCPAGNCNVGVEQSADFVPPDAGQKTFAIFARNTVGRYSFGVPIDTTGETPSGATDISTIRPPAVTITASPLEGTSPLTVEFNGNAIGDLEIDPSRTAWDFDVSDGVTVDADTPQTSHTYVVPAGETTKFTALLKMFDVINNEGSASVQIRVTGPADGAGDTDAGTSDIAIVVDGDQSTDPRCRTDVCGDSPFTAVLRVAAAQSNTVLSVLSVVWDLGDGSTDSTQSVFHTYVNTGDIELVIPVTVSVTFQTTGGAIVSKSATSLITIIPGTAQTDLENPTLPGAGVGGGGGGAAAPCGTIGFVFPLLCLPWLLRSFRRRRP